MTKEEAIAVTLTSFVKYEWQHVYWNEPTAVKVADALSVLTGVVWAHAPHRNGRFMVYPMQQVEWVKP